MDLALSQNCAIYTTLKTQHRTCSGTELDEYGQGEVVTAQSKGRGLGEAYGLSPCHVRSQVIPYIVDPAILKDETTRFDGQRRVNT